MHVCFAHGVLLRRRKGRACTVRAHIHSVHSAAEISRSPEAPTLATGNSRGNRDFISQFQKFKFHRTAMQPGPRPFGYREDRLGRGELPLHW